MSYFSFEKIGYLFIALVCMVPGASAQGSPDIVKQTLDKNASNIQFNVESNLVNGSGDFSDYIARLDLSPKDLSRSSLAFTLNLAEVDLSSGPPQVNFLLQNLLASMPDPKVSFRSSKVEVLAPNRLRISGPVQFNHQTKQISFVSTVSEATLTTSRFRGELSGNGFNPLAGPGLKQNSGGMSGKVVYDLVFKRSFHN